MNTDEKTDRVICKAAADQDGPDGADSSEVKNCTGTSPKHQRFREQWKNPEYRQIFWQTIWLGASFWALGYSCGQKGPAFLDIQIITQTDVEQASFFFTSGSVGYLVGSLVAGIVYDLLNKSLLFLLCVVGLGLSVISVPWCSVYGLMLAIQFLVSVFGGAIDTSGNTSLVEMWGTDGNMAMQFIHFAFALGGVIGPLATEPFLTPNPDEDTDTITTTAFTSLATNNSTGVTNLTMTTPDFVTTPDSADNSTAPFIPLTTNVHYAFLISGSIILLVAIPLTVQFFFNRSRKRRQDEKDEKKIVKQLSPFGLFLFVQGTLCFFYYLYCAVEDTFASFLTTFVVKQLRWKKSSGAQVCSVFWASFAAGRFLCIFVVHVISSVKLLMLSCVSLLLAMLAVLFFAAQNNHVGIWVSAVFAGIAMAAIFPTGFSWMEEELVRVTGRVSATILIASSTGTMLNPIIVGYLMQELTPMWFAYLLVVQAAACLAVFIFLLAVSRLYLRKHNFVRRPEPQEVVIPSLNPDQNRAESKHSIECKGGEKEFVKL
ncbi:hypothetical protein ACOMHN_041680 [Nucella lapillus]